MNHPISILTLAGSLIGVATLLPYPSQEGSDLPTGVTRITLPPGEVSLESILSKKTPTVKIAAGQTVIEGQRLFFGDGKVAMEVEATKEGLHFPSAGGKRGFVLEGAMINEPGASIDLGRDYLTLDEMKAGTIYVITPSVRFKYEVRPKPQPQP